MRWRGSSHSGHRGRGVTTIPAVRGGSERCLLGPGTGGVGMQHVRHVFDCWGQLPGAWPQVLTALGQLPSGLPSLPCHVILVYRQCSPAHHTQARSARTHAYTYIHTHTYSRARTHTHTHTHTHAGTLARTHAHANAYVKYNNNKK